MLALDVGDGAGTGIRWHVGASGDRIERYEGETSRALSTPGFTLRLGPAAHGVVLEAETDGPEPAARVLLLSEHRRLEESSP